MSRSSPVLTEQEERESGEQTLSNIGKTHDRMKNEYRGRFLCFGGGEGRGEEEGVGGVHTE